VQQIAFLQVLKVVSTFENKVQLCGQNIGGTAKKSHDTSGTYGTKVLRWDPQGIHELMMCFRLLLLCHLGILDSHDGASNLAGVLR